MEKGTEIPPCSGRPGIVLAPSRPTLALSSSSAAPACTLIGWGLSSNISITTSGSGAQKDSRQRNVPLSQWIRGNQLALAAVPFRQHLGRWRAAQDAGVDEAGELDVRDVPAGAVDAFEVPDGFGSAGGVSGLGVDNRGKGVPTRKDSARRGNRPGVTMSVKSNPFPHQHYS